MEAAPRFFRHGPSLLARLVFFVMLSLILMAVDSRFKYVTEVPHVLSPVIYPLQKLATVPIAIYDNVSEFFRSHHLTDENAELLQRKLFDQGQLQRLQALEAENVHLRKLLDASGASRGKAVMAEILHIPRDPFNRKVTLIKAARAESAGPGSRGRRRQ